MSELVEKLINEIERTFPEQAKKYHNLIRSCVTEIVNALPEDMSREEYLNSVQKNLRLVKNGEL